MSAPNTTRRPRPERACAEGQVWTSWQDRLTPTGFLLDLSEAGLRYHHDQRALGADGFPVPAPEAGQQLLLAVTLRFGERPRPMSARVVRVALAKDGSVEVASRFETHAARDLALRHQEYVAASLQRARRNLADLRARLFNEPAPERFRREKLGRILVKRHTLGRAELDAFLQGNRGGVRLGEDLVRAGLVTARQLAEALGEHLGLPFVDLAVASPSPEAQAALPPGAAQRLGVVAFAIERGKLLVASSRPLTLFEEKELAGLCRLRVKAHLAAPEQVAAFLNPSSPGRHRRTKPRVAAGAVVRYRLYGFACQSLDPRIFEGAAANVSETGVLLGGPIPRGLLADFQRAAPPRTLMAVQFFHGAPQGPALLRVEPVRISLLAQAERNAWDSGLPDAPLCWIGARLSPCVSEDRGNLLRLYKSLRACAPG